VCVRARVRGVHVISHPSDCKLCAKLKRIRVLLFPPK